MDLPPSLQTKWLGRAWRHLASCESTNDEARAWAERGAPHGAVVTSDRQTRGRGQRGRVWHSEVKNLYYSVVLRPTWTMAEAPPLTLAVGVALCEAARWFDSRATLKWPNDVLIDGKKIAGILTEGRAEGAGFSHIVVGVGCNLGEQAFPDELAAIATWLDADRSAFTATLCAALEARYEQLARGERAAILADWQARSSIFGRQTTVSTPSGPIVGTPEALDDDGALCLRTAGGVVRIVSGELQ